MKSLQIDKREISKFWPVINRLAKRRFEPSLSEEAALFVLNKLLEDNCRRVNSFSGKAQVSTFLSALSIRLLEDFSRKKFGRVRPPAWLTALGGYWLAMFDALCLQRLKVNDAVEWLFIKYGKKDELEKAAWTILARITNCGKRQAHEIEFDETVEAGQRLGREEDHLDTPEELFALKERKIFLAVLLQGLFSDDNSPKPELLFESLRGVKIQLKPEERILLKLCFQDGLSVSKAGEMLGINSNQAHGKLRRLLSRLRNFFKQAGIANELLDLLQS